MKLNYRIVWILAVVASVGCAQLTTGMANKDITAMTDALIREMKEYFGENQGLIKHTLAVYGYVEQIWQVEGGDTLVVRASAIYHDIGIPEAKRVHGSAAGKYQEIEGPPIARNILTKLGLEKKKLDHICRIIANHHTAHDKNTVATIEFKILWDADALVNLERRRANTSKEKFRRIIEETFRTKKGLQIAKELFLGQKSETPSLSGDDRELQSPVRIDIEKLSADFSGQVKVENHYDSTNLRQCRFEWKLAKLPAPREKQDTHTVLAKGTVPGPNVKPGGKDTLKLGLPDNWSKANVLYVTAIDPSGSQIRTWSRGLQQGCESCHQYVPKECKKLRDVKPIETQRYLAIQADGLKLWFDKKTGQLAKVQNNGRNISLSKGPRLLVGNSKLSSLRHWSEKDSVFIEAKYDSNLNYAKWKVYPSGWVRLDYQYELEGQFDLMGITFDYPQSKMVRMKWVGAGPLTKGELLDVWSSDYKNHTQGPAQDFPGFRGYYANWHWATFETKEGKITLLNGTEDLFLGVYGPKNGTKPANTKLDLPEAGISLLHAIPAMYPGPESQKNNASGKYKGAVCFYFETRKYSGRKH